MTFQVGGKFRDVAAVVGTVWVMSPEQDDIADDGTVEAAWMVC
jgi:hypothetical protein